MTTKRGILINFLLFFLILHISCELNAQENLTSTEHGLNQNTNKESVQSETVGELGTNEKKDDTQLTSTSTSDFVEDPRCKSGYGIPTKVLQREKTNENNVSQKIQELTNEKILLEKQFVEFSSNEKNKKSSTYKKELKIFQDKIKKNKDSIGWQNYLKKKQDAKASNEMCYLIDISKVNYDKFSNEENTSFGYLLVNDETKAIVAEKNNDVKFNARDFTKFYFLGLLNDKINKHALDPNYLITVHNDVYNIQNEVNLQSVGLMPGKSYKLIDLINLLKYNNYDDVMYVLANDLFENPSDCAASINEFLNKNVGLKNTTISNIYGLNKGDVKVESVGSNETTIDDLLSFKYYAQNNNLKFVSNVPYETKLESLEKTKSVNKENSMMDKNGDWYYSDVIEYFFSSYKQKEVSGIFSINKMRQKYSLILVNESSRENLYSNTTKLLKNAVNYKYSNILLSRKDDEKINKIFEELGISRTYNVRHKEKEGDSLKVVLGTSFSTNMPDNYLQYMKTKIVMYKTKYYAPIKEGDVIGKIIFDDSKEQKILKFGGGHVITLNLYADKTIQRKNIMLSIMDGISTFFQRWINATSRIKESE